MNIVISINQVIPASLYGGSERVVWDLGKALVDKGHKVTFMAKEGSSCSFATMLPRDHDRPLQEQLPPDTDVLHLNDGPDPSLTTPHLFTIHGNTNDLGGKFPVDSVFVSSAHAAKYGSDCFVHNGLDWDERYPNPDLRQKREYFHFLGKAAWRKKNVKGAIRITLQSGEKLHVLGGTRLNFKMGFRFTPQPAIKFHGMVSDTEKQPILQKSKGLVFPILWDEPFGLALTESLYFGCPVYGTPYGSLKEIVTSEVGMLSTSSRELSDAMKETGQFDPVTCHEYARENFSASLMADRYLKLYEKVANGEKLNTSQPQLIQTLTEKYRPFS